MVVPPPGFSPGGALSGSFAQPLKANVPRINDKMLIFILVVIDGLIKFKFSRDACRGVGSNPYIENRPVLLSSFVRRRIPRSSGVRTKDTSADFAGLQGYPLEPFQLFYRSGNRSKAVANMDGAAVGIAVGAILINGYDDVRNWF